MPGLSFPVAPTKAIDPCRNVPMPWTTFMGQHCEAAPGNLRCRSCCRSGNDFVEWVFACSGVEPRRRGGQQTCIVEQTSIGGSRENVGSYVGSLRVSTVNY